MNRTDILQELDREITIRRKVWRGYNAESGHVFYDTKHQKQYDRIVFAGDILEVMTDKEFQVLVERIERKKQLQSSQQSLF